jgi:hypothetical protein
MMSSLPSLAADMSDTDWDLRGRSRVWVRSEGRDFGRTNATMHFDADNDGTADGVAPWQIVVDAIPMPLEGTWSDDGGRRFKGDVDEGVLTEVLEAFLSELHGTAVEVTVLDTVRSRIKGHVGRDGERMRLKLRFKVDMEYDTAEGLVTRRAWVKLDMRGRLATGEPTL